MKPLLDTEEVLPVDVDVDVDVDKEAVLVTGE
jgi:hypothetical protein